MATEPNDLYSRDFYAWTREQAQALRAAANRHSNSVAQVDWAHVAEEVEDLGNEQRHAVESQLERLMVHLLELQHSPSARPRFGWQRSVLSARAAIAARWSPALARAVEPRLETIYRRARKMAASELQEHEEFAAAEALPADRPYTLEQLRDENWYPAEPDRTA
ncbi:MAG: DUF29 domain-containing protein [Geminicoccaceae bacterium]|nr:DUF29 domain-containing protein [Geminicoccaceae bacterium]